MGSFLIYCIYLPFPSLPFPFLSFPFLSLKRQFFILLYSSSLDPSSRKESLPFPSPPFPSLPSFPFLSQCSLLNWVRNVYMGSFLIYCIYLHWIRVREKSLLPGGNRGRRGKGGRGETKTYIRGVPQNLQRPQVDLVSIQSIFPFLALRVAH